MGLRDAPNVLVSRQSVLLATGVGVGMLTLAYVLGVQVGKQTAALRAGNGTAPGEMKELPESIADQLKAFEVETPGMEKAKPEAAPPPKAEEPSPKPEAKAPPKAEPKPAPKAEPKAPAKAEAKAEAKAAPKAEAKAAAAAEAKSGAKGEPRWTQQLVTTNDPAEAKRIAAKAREAGFDTVEVRTGDTIRVRVKRALPKADADAMGVKLKEKGLKPFAVKVE